MRAESGERVTGNLAKLGVAAPGAQYGSGTDDQRRKGEDDEAKIEAGPRPGGKPVHQMACGLRRLVRNGLNVAEEQRNHKKGPGKDQQDFQRGDGTFELHVYFV